MRFLHTSDWHLGQKFQHNDRIAEHQLALQWLLEVILERNVEVLLVAGDIFDIGNPPNSARKMYYQFLTKLMNSCCRHIVIIGGNHDSPSMLQAPKDLLEAINVYVVADATNNLENEIISLKNVAGQLEAIIAAVPFLRDRNLRYSVSGETSTERILAIRTAIQQHFQQIGALVSNMEHQTVPTIVMGHLYLDGVHTSAALEHKNIYIGDDKNMAAEHFPDVFDYVALGHIHRAQAIGNVHYSGSLIPLSFSETMDEKVVKIIDFDGKIPSTQSLAVPVFRRLKTIKKGMEATKAELTRLHEKYQHIAPTWVDIQLQEDNPIPNVDQELQAFAKALHLEILRIRTTYEQPIPLADSAVENLSDLAPIDVFERKCIREGYDETAIQELKMTFLELQHWMADQENE